MKLLNTSLKGPSQMPQKFLTPISYNGFRKVYLIQINPENFREIVCVVPKKSDAENLTFTWCSSASATVNFQIYSDIQIKLAHDNK